MNGKTLNIKIFVTGENSEKLDKIRTYLNAQNDVKSGDIEKWTKTDVYNLIFNSGINTEFERIGI